MRLPISIPLVLRNVKIAGPKGAIKVDLIFRVELLEAFSERY
jgi:hypothetical protein